MEWLNEGVGLIVIVAAVLTLALLGVILWLVFSLRSKIAVQRLHFLGFYATDLETREPYAEITIGNKSINEVALSELGMRNGNVSFDLTALYREKAGLGADARIVIEQRSAIKFRMTCEELLKVLVEGKNGKMRLGKLTMYAVDLTGNLYRGKIAGVRKLLSDTVSAQKAGGALPAAAAISAAPAAEPARENAAQEPEKETDGEAKGE